jgi:hypothetical protein
MRLRSQPTMRSRNQAFAVVGAILSIGCGSPDAPTSTSTQSPNLASISAATHELASGHADATQFGAHNIYSFNAHRQPNLKIEGQFEGSHEDATPFHSTFHGDVTCLRVVGNTAQIGVVITQLGPGSNPVYQVGQALSFTVEDNGEGSNDPPDGASILALVLPPFDPNTFCEVSIFAALPNAGNNVQVKDFSQGH